MYDHAKFCAALTHAPYRLDLSPRAQHAQALLDAAAELDPNMDLRWLAYCLATALWETAATLEPIREIGEGRGRRYGMEDPETHQRYYGRGYVQTTWKENYIKVEGLLKARGYDVDLVNNPDLLLQPRYAAVAMFLGMEHGIYTGKKLADFFGQDREDPRHAREIINGLDHATTVEGYYYQFKKALNAASA